VREYTYRRPKAVIEWKRTPGRFVAVLEPLTEFEPASIREVKGSGPETILVGTLSQTGQEDWYALAYNRNDYEFDEVRTLARNALERYRNGEDR